MQLFTCKYCNYCSLEHILVIFIVILQARLKGELTSKNALRFNFREYNVLKFSGGHASRPPQSWHAMHACMLYTYSECTLSVFITLSECLTTYLEAAPALLCTAQGIQFHLLLCGFNLQCINLYFNLFSDVTVVYKPYASIGCM